MVVGNLEKTGDVNSAFAELANYLSQLHTQFLSFENLAVAVKDNSTLVDSSTSELAAIIEEASASLEEMSATVENLNRQNQQIGLEMEDTEAVANTMTS
ncbi:hypothetical protein QGM71_14075 [Virgibacillus sp. C22-A2]|uniref:Methyl-accepting chemotaxis protein n=1 Tax=Virgibacillus tibetensis TaxID=3042313 RepID=A0ABU6KJR1_9BACI|nr:hypothetical protein [Virgibacillus sp. C22-A2]